MNYQILPMGDIWSEGMFSLPQKIVSSYLKMASEYQLKALLIIMANNGRMDSQAIAKNLGLTQNDVIDILDFWVSEGVMVCDGADNSVVVEKKSEPVQPKVVKTEEKEVNPVNVLNQIVVDSHKEQETKARKLENLPLPTLSPKDIVAMCHDNKELTELMRNAQEVMGKTLSHAEQEMLLNMVTYYGLPPAVVLTILHYYKSEKEKGKAIGTAYICAMAKNWAEEGVTDLKGADEKLREIENSDRVWNEITAISGIRHRSPTIKQRQMVNEWCESFSMEMIALACDAMKENADKPTLNYVDRVLKNWKKKNILTPQDVENDRISFAKSKEEKQDNDKIQSKPSYDIDEIQRKAMLNTDFDI